ncbi:MAG: leucine-rich repeat domain-containing protein [Oscillospiraceae bacterium]|jgi:hypothetical protein|nr:leucine-rich repeat domain-containing protein [Oscillospiraceae bacterium]
MSGNSKTKIEKIKSLISQYRLLSAIIALLIVAAIAVVGFVFYYTHREFEDWSGRLDEYHGRKSEIVIPVGITSIGIEAFKGNDKITSVVIPEGVTTIDEGAFMKCRSLTSITFPSSLTMIKAGAFSGCDALETLVLPDTITYIGEGAFANCEGLRSVVLPAGLPIVQAMSFYACPLLSDITFPEAVSAIGWRAFDDCVSLTYVTIPDSVTELGGAAFAHTSLESVVIPQNVTVLKAGVFSYCTQLKSVTILASPKEIPESAFEGCGLLPEIALPKSVETIGDRAFYKCVSLQKAEFPGTYNFGERAFAECAALTDVAFNKDGKLFVGTEAFLNCRSINRVSLSENTWFISAMAFSGSGLEEITVAAGNSRYVSKNGVLLSYSEVYALELSEFDTGTAEENPDSAPDALAASVPQDSVAAAPEDGRTPDVLVAFPSAYTHGAEYTVPFGIKAIASGAFYGANITNVVIPDGVEKIGKKNFYDCNSLTSVILPQSLFVLNEYSLSNCAVLTAVTLPARLPVLADGVLTDCPSLTSISAEPGGVFYSADGILYSADKIQLIRYPQGKTDAEFAIPDGTREIAPYAFYKNSYLERATVPASVWDVGRFNFSYCGRLLSADVGATVLYIDTMCFAGNGNEFVLRIHADTRVYAETYATEFGVRFERVGE